MTVLHVLSHLLHIANACPPCGFQDEFYALKDRLCRDFGELIGHDWQQIKHDCWGCYGTGRMYQGGDICDRCGGDGVFRWAYHKLERWQLGPRVFHRPIGSCSKLPPGETVTIKGRIQYTPVGSLRAWRAMLYLTLIFDRKTFFYMVRLRSFGWQWDPLLCLNEAWKRIDQKLNPPPF